MYISCTLIKLMILILAVVRMNSLKGRRGRLPSRSHLVQLGNQEIPHVNIAPELVKAHIERVTESSQVVY